MKQITYTRKQAAQACGLSEDTIRRAINSGDLETMSPEIDGRPISKVLIHASELERWLANK